MTTAQKRQYIGSIGKRKTSIARVKLYQDGGGEITVNGQKLKDYFAGIQIENAAAALVLVNLKGTVDIEARVVGGGKSSQSDALRHAISRALLQLGGSRHQVGSTIP